MAVLMDDQRLRDAHEKSCAIAFAELESFASRQTSGLTHGRENTGKVLAAAFTHDASRELDPQLHTHFVIANVTVGENGKRYALETFDMVKAVRYSGKVYQSEMARACKELGYEVELVRDAKRRVTGFEIVGVGEELRELYSKRRAQVEDGIEEFRLKYDREPSKEEIHDITVATRTNRYVLNEVTTADVRQKQLSQLTPDQKAELERIYKDAKGSIPKVDNGDAKEAWSYAVAHTFERVTVAPAHQLMAEAINSHLGKVDLEELKKQASSDNSLRELKGQGIQAQVCTVEGLKREELAIIFVNDSKGIREPLKSGELKMDGRLAVEQKKGIEFVCHSKDQVMAIRGIAGAGKTTMLKELDKNLTHVSRLYLAPTASAVAVLKAEGFSATTVSDYLNKCSNFQEPEEWKGALIVVDEAGMLSQKQGSELLRYAGSHANRVLLVGDVKQHSSVEAGDFLRVLETHSNLATHTLADIRRQKPPEYNAAIRLMSKNQCIQGLHALDELGWVHENGAGYLRNAAESYLEKRKLGSVLAVTPTWKENYALTELIRDGLKEEGVLKGPSARVETLSSLKWTVAEKRFSSNYEAGQWVIVTHGNVGPIEQGKPKQVASVEKAHLVFSDGTKLNVRQHGHQIDVANLRVIEVQEGDKIQLMTNDKKRGLFNGDVCTVKSLQPDGSLETEEGKTIPKGFHALTHGYVLTSHKSQGKTADNVVVAAEQLRSKACYVACSRGRETASVHTIEKDRLYSALPQSEDRLSATDILQSSRKEDRYRFVKNDSREEELRRIGQSRPVIVLDSPGVELERQKQLGHGTGVMTRVSK